MKELIRTNDPVKLNWAETLLRDAGLNPVVLDTHASVLDGSVLAIQRRLMLPDEEAERARAILAEADLDPK